jgi:hypothetical protein
VTIEGQILKSEQERGLRVRMQMSPTDERRQNPTTSGETNGEAHCPLCNISPEEVVAEFPRWKLARTKTMKGHEERLMLYHREHVRTLNEQSIGEAYILLSKIGSKFFSYTDTWAIFEPTYATVPDHWHRVASDLNENAQDYQQILKTPRMIIDNKEGTVSRVNPNPELPVPSSNAQ